MSYWISRRSFQALNKYYGYDDIKFKATRDVVNLFNGIVLNELIDQDYYRPIRTKSAFNVVFIKYQSKGEKYKKLTPKEKLGMIKPYLSHIINDHKIPKNSRIHSSYEVIDYETQFGEWKIQLTMRIIFISSKQSGGTLTIRTKSHSIEIMMGKEKTIILKNLVNVFYKIIKKD